MTDYTYSRVAALNFTTTPVTVGRSATGSVYAVGDITYTTPLNVTMVVGGATGTSISSDANGFFPDFTVANRTSVVFKQTGTSFTSVLTTTDPVPGPQGDPGTPGTPGAQGPRGDLASWQASTFYPLNQAIINPAGDIVKVITAHTSGVSYDASKFDYANNTVVDAQTAAKINDTGSATRTALNATYVSTLIAKGTGFDPTGATDSTPSFQALIDLAAITGAAISVPPGVYRIDALTLGPLTRIVGLGAGSTRFSASGVTAPLVIFKHQTSSVLPMITINGGGVSIENVEMQGNSSTAPLLHVENGFESKLSNIRLISVAGTALTVKRANNTKWYDVMVDNCGSATAAAVVIKSPTTAEGNETNTLDIYNLTIERCQNVALDVGFGGTRVDGFYAEFVRITNLHVEAPNDNGGLRNVDPLVRFGNVRNVFLINPFIYGGPGYLIEHASEGLQTAKLKEGLFIVGGALLGDNISTTPHLVHLTTGDDFSMVGVRAGRFTTSAVKVESTYGQRVKIDPTSSLDGDTSTWLTDSRTGWVFPQPNKSIGGTGTTGTNGGSVTTLNSSGAARNILDDGAGAASIAGILTLLAGMRWINRTVTTTQTLTLADMGVVSTATTVITLTLPASSNTMLYVKNSGTKHLLIAAPSSGSAPAIDGAASIALLPGEGAWLNGRSSSVGTWSVVSHSVEQIGAGVPALTPGANLGTTPPTPTLDAGSNDNRGRIQFGTGTTPSAGALITVTFATPFASAPFVQVSLAAQNGTGPFVKDVTTTGFVLGLMAAPAASQPVGTYAFSYRVAA